MLYYIKCCMILHVVWYCVLYDMILHVVWYCMLYDIACCMILHVVWYCVLFDMILHVVWYCMLYDIACCMILHVVCLCMYNIACTLYDIAFCMILHVVWYCMLYDITCCMILHVVICANCARNSTIQAPNGALLHCRPVANDARQTARCHAACCRNVTLSLASNRRIGRLACFSSDIMTRRQCYDVTFGPFP
jgi:hypothetical protein